MPDGSDEKRGGKNLLTRATGSLRWHWVNNASSCKDSNMPNAGFELFPFVSSCMLQCGRSRGLFTCKIERCTETGDKMRLRESREMNLISSDAQLNVDSNYVYTIYYNI